MPICPGKAVSKKLKRFNTSWDDHMKCPLIDITMPTSFDMDSDDDENACTMNTKSHNKKKKGLELFGESDLLFEGLLGSGGFSNVYHAYHRDTGRIFAVKKLKISVCQSQKLLPICTADLAVEAAVLANLNHENIIGIHGIRGDGNIMDLLKNGSFFICLDPLHETLDTKLSQWRRQTKKGSRLMRSSSRQMKNNATIIKRLEDVVMGIVHGMEYLHTNNIIYRDLKPGNIGFDEKTQKVKIFDFGLARVVAFDENGTNMGGQTRLMTRKIGTPRYMAPEIARGESDYGFGVDIYSFSILLWQLVTDRVAFDNVNSPAELKEQVSLFNLRPPIRHVPKLLLVPEEEPAVYPNKNSITHPLSKSFDSALLQEIIDSGWSDCAKSRPTFTTIRKKLDFIIKTSLVNSNDQIPKPVMNRRRSLSGIFRRSSLGETTMQRRKSSF